MNSNSTFVSKFIPIFVALLVIISGVLLYVVSQSQKTEIPYSSVESTIAAQNGELVTLKENQNGTLTLITPDGSYISHIPPNSQLVNKLVETYNVQYSFSSTSPFSLWLLGGIVAAIVATAIIIQRKTKGGWNRKNEE